MANFINRIKANEAKNRLNDECIAIERESLSQEHTTSAVAWLDQLSSEDGLELPINREIIHIYAEYGKENHTRKEWH